MLAEGGKKKRRKRGFTVLTSPRQSKDQNSAGFPILTLLALG